MAGGAALPRPGRKCRWSATRAQLAAVGPGGALADIAARGIRYELTEVCRFKVADTFGAALDAARAERGVE